MLIIVVLMLFKLEDKKQLLEEVKSQWSALRGFNWQHSKSYIIPQPTDLFCRRIFLPKFNMLTSFSPHFFTNIEAAYTPHMIFQWSKGIVAPPKNMERLFYKYFLWQIGDRFSGAVLRGGLMTNHAKSRGVSQMHFPVI